MADSTVSDLNAITIVADDDTLYIVDVSEVAADASKKITISELRKLFPTWGPAAAETIASGIVDVSYAGRVSVDTEAAAASDDLDKITGLNDGDMVILEAANDARSVVVKDGAYLKLQSDFTLNNQYDRITLQCIGSDTCVEISRSNNGS